MADGFDDYLKATGYSDEQVAAARADDSPSERADDCGEGPGCPFHGDGSTPGVVVEVPDEWHRIVTRPTEREKRVLRAWGRGE